jgi:hypothetical protein
MDMKSPWYLLFGAVRVDGGKVYRVKEATLSVSFYRRPGKKATLLSNHGPQFSDYVSVDIIRYSDICT